MQEFVEMVQPVKISQDHINASVQKDMKVEIAQSIQMTVNHPHVTMVELV